MSSSGTGDRSIRLAGACLLVMVAATVLLAGQGAAAAQGTVPLQATDVPVREVLITDDGLEPPIVAVRAGRPVRWINTTEHVHNTSHLPDLGQPVLWNSGDIPPGGGPFEHVFDEPGTYNYIDSFYAGDERYKGAVVVTSNLPTATPLTPTTGPTPTEGPTRVPPTATPTLPPTPTRPPPTKAPVTLVGQLYRHSDPSCPLVDARLEPCGDPAGYVPVRTDGLIDTMVPGETVQLNGVMMRCSPSAVDYLWLSSASPRPGGCGTPTATPQPTPTAPFSQADNKALGMPVTAKAPLLPGYEPANATDGDAGTVWYSPEQVSWIYVDLGKPTSFNQLRLRWAYPFAERYGIYVWEDGAWRGKFLADNNSGGEDIRNLAHIEAQFVMLYLMRSSVGAGGFSLAEIEVYGEERPNWAMGQPVVVSSEQAGHIGANATDGLAGTWWVSGDGDPNPWIGVYLPSSIMLSEYWLHWTTGYPRSYSLVFFENGVAKVSFYIHDTQPGLHRFRGAPVRADTFMVYTHESDPGGKIGLAEVEIYGPGPGDDVPPEDVTWLEPVDLLMSWAAPRGSGSGEPFSSLRAPVGSAFTAGRGSSPRSLVLGPRQPATTERVPPPPADAPVP